MQNQELLRHHFLPVFFLEKWAGVDDRLIEFSKPYKNTVRPRRTHPKGTGFIDRLYAIEGFSGEMSYEVERSFLSPVDSRASTALDAMLAGNQPSPAERDAWARFVMSSSGNILAIIATPHCHVLAVGDQVVGLCVSRWQLSGARRK
ncbi:DUF4238 domain-containing protein [Rhizobium leguminosarum]|uniref:DUF4238 domain-containing protein n=1 Tax=Rhizobium leguminosarum TaxID=384 RepID=UPI003F9D81A2